MKVGYVRVSTAEQNSARQDEIMRKLEVEKVYTDRLSGKNAERAELQRMMDFVREGDSVIVESISRFARNTKDLLELVERLTLKRVHFVSQKEKIDTSTPAGKFSGYWSGEDDGSDLYDYYLFPHGWHRLPLGEYVKSCSTQGEKPAGVEWVWINYDPGKAALVASAS